jgi:hypothetical protein
VLRPRSGLASKQSDERYRTNGEKIRRPFEIGILQTDKGGRFRIRSDIRQSFRPRRRRSSEGNKRLGTWHLARQDEDPWLGRSFFSQDAINWRKLSDWDCFAAGSREDTPPWSSWPSLQYNVKTDWEADWICWNRTLRGHGHGPLFARFDRPWPRSQPDRQTCSKISFPLLAHMHECE